jgi:cell division protein FtsL
LLAVSRKDKEQFTTVSYLAAHEANMRRMRGVSSLTITLYIVGIMGVAGMLILYLCQCAQIVSSQYKICRLKETKSTLERSRLALKLEVNRLCSLERIENKARKELGMTHPPVRLVLDMRQPVVQASLEDVVAVEKIPKN